LITIQTQKRARYGRLAMDHPLSDQCTEKENNYVNNKENNQYALIHPDSKRQLEILVNSH